MSSGQQNLLYIRSKQISPVLVGFLISHSHLPHVFYIQVILYLSSKQLYLTTICNVLLLWSHTGVTSPRLLLHHDKTKYVLSTDPECSTARLLHYITVPSTCAQPLKTAEWNCVGRNQTKAKHWPWACPILGLEYLSSLYLGLSA